jgi:hypothetical protein
VLEETEDKQRVQMEREAFLMTECLQEKQREWLRGEVDMAEKLAEAEQKAAQKLAEAEAKAQEDARVVCEEHEATDRERQMQAMVEENVRARLQKQIALAEKQREAAVAKLAEERARMEACRRPRSPHPLLHDTLNLSPKPADPRRRRQSSRQPWRRPPSMQSSSVLSTTTRWHRQSRLRCSTQPARSTSKLRPRARR